VNDLDLTIRRWRDDASTLRRHGNVALAETLDRCAIEAERSAEQWLTWLTEADAVLQSGRSAKWLRSRFTGWNQMGHARQVGRGKRIYRQAIVPVRPEVREAMALGREAARRFTERAA